ncbi:alpha/beta hydrolase [Streptomyces pactum]|uniref:alpha/beta hydrolase n=1 Tax=Streptomyces pactum TaxID=68249 RepID=UPI0036FF428E
MRMITRRQPHPNAGRRVLSVLLTLTASAAALAVPGPASATPAGAPAPTGSIRWGTCPASDPLPAPGPQVQCGTLRVPVDWSQPDGPTTDIFVARHRATDPGRRVGVLMTNPGGPGAPGADSAMYADDPYSGYSASLRERFDIVGFDPRGIGRSNSVTCDESIRQSLPARPRDAAGFNRLRTLNGRLADSCLERSGPLAAHMDGGTVARDMDAIRAALGERTISFIGHSYGTFLGERYARLFPENLRALALDSAMDPERPDAERYLTDGSVAVEGALKKVAAWCAQDASCVLKGEDVLALTSRLFDRAEAGTLHEPGPTGPTRRKLTADQLSGILTAVLRGWSPQVSTEQLAALHTGKGEVHLWPGRSDSVVQLVLCRDNDFRIRDHAEYRAIMGRVAKAAPHVRYNAQALDMVLGCQGWSMPPKPRPAQASGDLPPALVANARYDQATPLPGARRMARAFPGARLHVSETVGHWLYTQDDVKQVLDSFLLSPGS